MTTPSPPIASWPSPPVSPRKLRILCLHGYHGSGDVLRGQMGALVAELEPMAELVFVDAPSLADSDHGWWHAVDDERAPRSDDPGVAGPRRHYKGWARTRDAIAARFASDGPFDGVLGFSQGAALAGLLVGLRAPDGRPTPERPLAFGFAILFSGFPSNDPELARLYARRDSYALPSLHVFGRADGIVAPAVSRALAAQFGEPVLVEHDGGHAIAGGAQVRAFVEAQRAVIAGAATLAVATPSAAPSAQARAPIDVPLWRGRSGPAMRVVFPARPTAAPAAALVVFRGGAYAINHGSGGDAADWAAAHGMVGVEVPYRCAETGDVHPASYADAARAVRLVRDHAAAWGVDPARVGVLGFSAGGHLASLLSTQPRLHLEPDDDLAARVPARPDFVILGYPVISFVEGYSPGAFVSSAENFFGRRELDEALRRQFSNELHVAADHPPVFVWTTADDALVPASHAQVFAEACHRAGVPVTLRVYPHGPHGMGLALDRSGDVGGWTAEALAWLDERNLRR
jgi:acetyl esterase/lipase